MIADGPTKKGMPTDPGTDVLMLRTVDCARVLGVCGRTIRSWDTGGLLPRAICIGRVKFWRRKDLENWCDMGCPERPEFERMQEQATRR